jgi:hypothetical protein
MYTANANDSRKPQTLWSGTNLTLSLGGDPHFSHLMADERDSGRKKPPTSQHLGQSKQARCQCEMTHPVWLKKQASSITCLQYTQRSAELFMGQLEQAPDSPPDVPARALGEERLRLGLFL